MRRVTRQFALCLENRGNEASLIRGKVYRILPDVQAAKDDLLRVIDESGEDYGYASDRFFSIHVPKPLEKVLVKVAS